MQTTLHSSARLTTPTTSKAPDPVSPIAEMVEALAAQLACAQENMTLLYLKLEPVRAICPQSGDGEHRPPAASPLEGRLAELIDSASFLNLSLCNLRAELRI